MPEFSFAPVAKPVKVKSTSKPNDKYTNLFIDIEGTVFLNIKGEYKVIIGDEEFDIIPENYTCVGATEIFEQNLFEDINRVRHIRSEGNKGERDITMYLPFTAGCCVKGNIVKHSIANTTLFKIKKVSIDPDDLVARNAIKFYRDNYHIIRKAIDDKIITNKVKQIFE